MKLISWFGFALVPASGIAAPISVSVDFAANVHPVSPLIFGVAHGISVGNVQMGYRVDRWGGISIARWNWQIDVHNTASDYSCENIPDCEASICTGTPPLGKSTDAFIGATQVSGALPSATIPTIGWIPHADSPHQHPYFAGFALSKQGVQQQLEPYDTSAANGRFGKGTQITGNDPTDTSMAGTPMFEAWWIARRQATVGTASPRSVPRSIGLARPHSIWPASARWRC